MTIEELRKRLIEIRNEAQAIVDAADKDNNGEMTEEQEGQFDALMSEREKVEANIKRLEKLQDMDKGTGRQSAPVKPGQTKVRVIESKEPHEEDPMCGFTSAADFGRAVQMACIPGGEFDPRLNILGAPTNFHRETGSSDGYMVPPAVRQEVWRLVFEDEGILQSVAPEPTESNSVEMYADESTPWGSTGVQANWAAEGVQFSPSRLETEKRNVPLHKLYAFVLATEELLSDAPRLTNRLTVQAAEAIRWKADSAIVEGDGRGKPLGWMTSGALVTVAKESGQSADTIVAANVLKMFSRLIGNTAGAFWLANRSTVPQLGVMTIGDQPIWTPPNGLVNAPGGFLLGLPIRLSDHAEVVGDKGDIQLIAPRGYYATNKAGGIDFAASMHLYFDYSIHAFRWTFRLGGQPYLSAPISPAKGSETRSHFITLAERT